MAVLSKEDLLKKLQERFGEDSSDEVLSVFEDVEDTFANFEKGSIEPDAENWKDKYNELDTTWRQKYKDRFMNGETDPGTAKQEQKENVIEDGTEKTYEDLFVEREG